MTRTLRVLLVEDSPDDELLVLRALGKAGHDVEHTRVETAAAMSAALDAGGWDIIISDHRLPQFTSTEALKLLQQRQIDLPFVICSGTIGEESAVAAMKAGAHDYVMKGNLARLGAVVARELKEAGSRAERRRAEAALEVSEQRLRQAQKMEAIGRLAGGIAHDFNNLLTAIIGYSELLLSQLDEGPVRRDVVEIKQAGDRAAALTRQLLAFSRQQVLEPQVVDLNAIARNIDQLLRRLIGEDVDLAAEPAADLGRTKADPGQIEQVIMNLAINARDAMPDGGRLTIRTSNVEVAPEEAIALGAPAGAYVLLEVEDTGVGMDAETQSRIFEPFFTTKDPNKGTGLGLSTVYGIVQQSGGAIGVSSAPGRGTTFRVYLPRVDAPLSEARRPPAPPAEPTTSETILIAEDEAAIRNLLRTVLGRAGYTLVEGSTAEEALERLESHAGPVDLLISDVVMPGLNGPELLARVRLRHPGVPVLFLSGYTDLTAFGAPMTEDSLAFLAKPFTPTALRNKVREVLNGQRGSRL
jgi:two-component system cell cycle sensor histidine kinase/response regulator CckA